MPKEFTDVMGAVLLCQNILVMELAITLDKINKCLKYAGRTNYNKALENITTPLLAEIKRI